MYQGERCWDKLLSSRATAQKLPRARELEQEVDVRNVQPGRRLGGLLTLQQQSIPLELQPVCDAARAPQSPTQNPASPAKAMQPREEGMDKVWKV